MAARTLLVAAGALAAGVGLGLVLAKPPAAVRESAAPATTDPAADLREELHAMRAALDELLERERLVRPATVTPAAPAPAPSPERSPESARTPVGAPEAGAELADLVVEQQRTLERMNELLESMREKAVQGGLSATLPSLALLESGPEGPNWPRLQQLVDEVAAGGGAFAAVEERLKWTPQEEILRTYGRPSRIAPKGEWYYVRASPGGTLIVKFGFVMDYVMSFSANQY